MAAGRQVRIPLEGMPMRSSERISTIVFAIFAAIVVITMAAVFVFVGAHAFQTFFKTPEHPAISIGDFFGTAHWSPDDGYVGAQALIVGSILTTLLAVVVATPISVGVAVFVVEVAPGWARQFMQPVLELMTGLPSVIIGFIGLVVLVPWVRTVMNSTFGQGITAGFGLIAAVIVLTVMIMPTITTLSIDALAALPVGLREGSLALGATRWQSVAKTLLPAAQSGIYTGVILGMGRAIGETLAVALVIGATPNNFPIKLLDTAPYIRFSSTSTITTQLLADFREATTGSLGYDAIWSLSFVLLVISFVLVLIGRQVASRSVYSDASKQPGGPAPMSRVAAAAMNVAKVRES